MRRVLIGVLTVLLLAAAGLTGFLAVDEPDEAPVSAPAGTGPGTVPSIKDGTYTVGSLPDGEAKEALEAAVAALPVALSFDYRTLDESRDRAIALMTERLAAEYRDIFERTTRPSATDKKAVTSALVRGAGVIDPVRAGKVRCLVYLDQLLLQSKTKKNGTSYTEARVRVTMQRVDGTWKVDEIEPF